VPILSICGVSRKRYELSLWIWAKENGMARSDDGETWAFPHKTLEGNDLETKLIIELKKTRTEGVVLGLPRNMDGTEGEMAVAVRALGQRLEDVGFTVDFGTKGLRLGWFLVKTLEA